MEKQKQKELYEKAELNVVMLNLRDVIATSDIDPSDTDFDGVQSW